jgi:hypothetical protein
MGEKNLPENVEIIDNFLEESDFARLQEYIMGNGFDWYYLDGVTYPPAHTNPENEPWWEKLTPEERKIEEDGFLFVNVLYSDNTPNSSDYDMLRPALDKLDIMSLWRIKVNLLTRTPTHVQYADHVDIFPLENDERANQWRTAVLYINDNNGWTRFADGTTCESVANRLLIFPSHLWHTSVTCTDEKTRVLINFNFYQNNSN